MYYVQKYYAVLSLTVYKIDARQARIMNCGNFKWGHFYRVKRPDPGQLYYRPGRLKYIAR